MDQAFPVCPPLPFEIRGLCRRRLERLSKLRKDGRAIGPDLKDRRAECAVKSCLETSFVLCARRPKGAPVPEKFVTQQPIGFGRRGLLKEIMGNFEFASLDPLLQRIDRLSCRRLGGFLLEVLARTQGIERPGEAEQDQLQPPGARGYVYFDGFGRANESQDGIYATLVVAIEGLEPLGDRLQQFLGEIRPSNFERNLLREPNSDLLWHNGACNIASCRQEIAARL